MPYENNERKIVKIASIYIVQKSKARECLCCLFSLSPMQLEKVKLRTKKKKSNLGESIKKEGERDGKLIVTEDTINEITRNRTFRFSCPSN
jgi:hypothetical protein